MQILALSGSLRAASENIRLLRAAAQLAPADVRVVVYAGLGELPLFNPDVERPNPPAVAALRLAINAADALIIASPEYAHGVSAVIKNALDWMVGNEAFVDKPVTLLNAAPRATHAYLALRETVTMIRPRGGCSVPHAGTTSNRYDGSGDRATSATCSDFGPDAAGAAARNIIPG